MKICASASTTRRLALPPPVCQASCWSAPPTVFTEASYEDRLFHSLPRRAHGGRRAEANRPLAVIGPFGSIGRATIAAAAEVRGCLASTQNTAAVTTFTTAHASAALATAAICAICATVATTAPTAATLATAISTTCATTEYRPLLRNIRAEPIAQAHLDRNQEIRWIDAVLGEKGLVVLLDLGR